MNILARIQDENFDRANALVAAFVFLVSFIVYRLTVAHSFSFWDCGEFIACANILGVPHPPGWPLFVVLGRIFAVLPIASDISFRVNMISVITSAGAALFGYLVLVRIIKYWYQNEEFSGWKRIITYIGGVIGSLFLAFSYTHWGNAVEAEVLGLSMMFMSAILWLSLQYYDNRGTAKGQRLMVLICFLGMLSIAAHLTTFLIMPVVAIFLILKKDAPPRVWIAISAFLAAELLAIIIVSNGRGGLPAFIGLTLLMLVVVAIMVYRYISWPILIAIGGFSMIMVGFYEFLFGLLGAAVLILLVAYFARESEWRTALAILFLAVIGFSFHLFIPIRSAQHPRIDENMTSRSFRTFVDFLDRKQYGRESMVERMFQRRATWGHQFGRHANMGFWSYFEEQYSNPGFFGILFVLGLLGAAFAVMKKLEVGLPFLILLIMSSVGLILYMNFADGIMYNQRTGDAYLEVRNRDYFFTPAFIFFGLAIGMGIAAVMEWVRTKTLDEKHIRYQKPALAILSLAVLLPSLALAQNYYPSDHSKNNYPYMYAYNILATCQKDAILFTSGDNDTFPLWAIQEVYNFRKDVRVVNLSLFNTDWYVYQMKNQYNVPISLSDDQILWYPEDFEGEEIMKPKKPFHDRARKRMTYLVPLPFEGRVVKLQDMLVDDVVLTNNFKYPIYFSSDPYSESPLKLRDLSVADGILYRLDKNPPARKIDVDDGYRLFKEVYRYDGLDDPTIFRDENASGVMLALGFNAIRIFDEFQRTGQMDRAEDILKFIIGKYPEFFQSYVALAQFYKKQGDSVQAEQTYVKMESTLADLHRRNPSSTFYTQDLGMAKFYRGDVEGGLALLWQAFLENPNSSYSYRKLIQILIETKRHSDIIRATQMYTAYKNNLDDPIAQQILGQTQSIPPPIEP